MVIHMKHLVSGIKRLLKFIEYNIQDVEIVDKLEDKMKLIELCLTMAYDGKVNYRMFLVRTILGCLYIII